MLSTAIHAETIDGVVMAYLRALLARNRCLAKSAGRRFVHDGSGATAVEYGVLLCGIALLVLVAVFSIGDELEDLFTAVQTQLSNSYS